ncbi:MAG: hypothetical protein IIY74_07155 [Firmicutes bacterium]|nr:hypothetical protein [Bacillota bacterium]
MEEKKTPLTYRILIFFIKLFSPKYEITGTENIPEGPCIIAGNHSQMYGPIAAEFYTPGPHYIWCEAEMMVKEEVQEYAFNDFWSGKPGYIRWYFKLLSYLIVPISVLLFNNAHTIGVRHDMRVIGTFRETVEKLRQGYRVVIFPEDYDEHNNIVHDFRDKFIDTARFYYKKTGEELVFVPMYLCPRLRKMIFGAAVRFDASAPIDQERRRIADHLMDEITRIAIELPEHVIVPYPNIPKKDYPRSRPLKEYPHV